MMDILQKVAGAGRRAMDMSRLHGLTLVMIHLCLQMCDSVSAEVNFNDPLYPDQKWYLSDSPGTGRGEGLASLHVAEAWEVMGPNSRKLTGHNITVMVVDDGVYWNNPELNIDHSLCYNAVTKGTDPSPSIAQSHGTMVAGVIGAQANNSLCGVGVAHGAIFGGINLGLSEPGVTVDDEMEATSLNYKLDVVDIYHNSWGPPENNQLLGAVGPLTQQALLTGVTQGRDTKGVIYVFAAGNGGLMGDRCGYDGYAQSRYTIAVSGLNNLGELLRSTEPCSAVMVTSYSVDNGGTGIVSTSGTSGCDNSLTDSSAAAPFVSGIIALALQANPNLNWRQVQHLITKTSNSSNLQPADSWITNGHNFTVSSYYGFGLIDAYTMVQTAALWESVTLPAQVTCTVNRSDISVDIPLTAPIAFSADGCQHIKYLEHVEVHVNLTFTYRGHIGINLTSPHQTDSHLLGGRYSDVLNNTLDWKATSVHFWGEAVDYETSTEWKLNLYNVFPVFNSTGFLYSWSVTFYGMTEEPDFPVHGQNRSNTCPIVCGEGAHCESWSDKWTCVCNSLWDLSTICKLSVKDILKLIILILACIGVLGLSVWLVVYCVKGSSVCCKCCTCLPTQICDVCCTRCRTSSRSITPTLEEVNASSKT